MHCPSFFAPCSLVRLPQHPCSNFLFIILSLSLSLSRPIPRADCRPSATSLTIPLLPNALKRSRPASAYDYGSYHQRCFFPALPIFVPLSLHFLPSFGSPRCGAMLAQGTRTHAALRVWRGPADGSFPFRRCSSFAPASAFRQQLRRGRPRRASLCPPKPPELSLLVFAVIFSFSAPFRLFFPPVSLIFERSLSPPSQCRFFPLPCSLRGALGTALCYTLFSTAPPRIRTTLWFLS